MKKHKILLLIIVLAIFTSSCKKYLNKKSEMKLYVPETWQDLQALLDNNTNMNLSAALALPELLGGDFYVADNVWNSAIIFEKGNYVWDTGAKNGLSWALPYKTNIYISNVVLDNIEKVNNKVEIEGVNNTKGSALFFRSLGFYNLTQLFCLPYNAVSANSDLGLVLKLNGDVEEKQHRSNNTETYNQIISDLKNAEELLPILNITTLRPSKTAARALLARVYLSMSDYANAEKYADLVLSSANTLLDYNTLIGNGAKLPTFAQNPEIIFLYRYQNMNLNTQGNARIDLSLYNLYEANDLRKTLFFQANTGSALGSYRFKGSYYNDVPSSVFNGLAVDEVLFIKMECLVRKGNFSEAIKQLNDFLKLRYTTGLEKVYAATTVQEALQIILTERRKQLVFRGLRWTDIRRLNLGGANITLERIINGQTYQLPPNDLRYALLIPDDEVLRFGMQQNLR